MGHGERIKNINISYLVIMVARKAFFPLPSFNECSNYMNLIPKLSWFFSHSKVRKLVYDGNKTYILKISVSIKVKFKTRNVPQNDIKAIMETRGLW